VSVNLIGSAISSLMLTCNSTSPSIQNNAETAVAWDLAYTNTGATSTTSISTPHMSWSSTTPSAITITAVGIYVFSAWIEWNANATGIRLARFESSNQGSILGAVSQVAVSGGNNTHQQFSSRPFRKTGSSDVISVMVTQTSGGALASMPTTPGSFSCIYLGP
jgi:hypothetical protein